MKKILLMALALVGALNAMNAQQLAFPGAEGYGAYASGGRGCQVVHVTNLNAAGSGSLADAVSQPNRFKFPDFTVQQLCEISKQRIKKYNYHFTPKAWRLYKELVAQQYEHRDKKKWGNAREMAHLLDKIYIHHANRCMNASDPKKMFAITVADVKPVEGTLSTPPKQRIGFR